MCTITLSYDKNNQVASRHIAALLSTGLFVKLDSQEDLEIDYSDSSLYKTDRSLPKIDRDLTPEDLEKMIVEDIHSIYEAKYAL